MPGGNGNGPMGMGPMTGRGAGTCTGFPIGSYSNSMPGRGLARGRGGGRGFGRGMGRSMGFRWTTPNTNGTALSVQDEANMLKNQASSMQSQIDSINIRIKELEASPAQENE